MTALYSLLRSLNQGICRICTGLVSVSLGAICVILFSGVACRYLLNDPISWTEDVTCLLLVWMVLLGAPVAMRVRAHVAIDMLVERLPRGLRLPLRILSTCVVLYVAWFMVRYGVGFTAMGMRRVVPSLDWLPYGYVYLALPVGYGLMLLVCLELILDDLVTLFGRKKGS